MEENTSHGLCRDDYRLGARDSAARLARMSVLLMKGLFHQFSATHVVQASRGTLSSPSIGTAKRRPISIGVGHADLNGLG